MKQQSIKHKELEENFKKELQITVGHKLNEINHFVSGCNSPFTYQQIGMVQDYLVNIAETLGIKFEDFLLWEGGEK